MTIPFKADKRLKTSYDKYNAEYWDGRLPKDTQIGYSEDLGDDDECLWGLTLGLEVDESHHRTFIIYLDAFLKEKRMYEIRLLTLLHEMCHAALFPYVKHGKRFDDEMLRIASRGAFDGLW